MIDKMKEGLLHEIKKIVQDSVQQHKYVVEDKLATLKEDIQQRIKSEAAKIMSNLVTRVEITTKVNEVKALAMQNEQYSRKSNIRMFGIKGEANEDPTSTVLKLLKEKLNVQLPEKGIDAAHRSS